MDKGWAVYRNGQLMASGSMEVMYDDATVRSMIAAGYKVLVNGKAYTPGRKRKERGK